jgi:RNase P/RNase MRP subunit p29
MRAHIRLVLSILCVFVFPVVTAHAEENLPNAPSAMSAQTQGNGHVVEGVVVSITPTTLVVRTDDNQFHLFTYEDGTVPKETVKPGVRVRISGSAPDSVGTSVAEKSTVIHVIEGTVISTTPETLVVRTDDNGYHLFTYSSNTVPKESVKPDVRVRVNAIAPNPQAARVAESVTAIQPGTGTNVAGTTTVTPSAPAPAAAPAPSPAAPAPSPAAPVSSAAAPAPNGTGAQAEGTREVNPTSLRIVETGRRFHIGGRVGFGLDPELFMFGTQAQFGPFFDHRFMFQPNLEFGFGEITDMYAVNGDAAFHFRRTETGWRPYFGMGPGFNFVNRSASIGQTSFGDFHFSTGLNVFAGMERRQMFVELKTIVWATNAPILRMYIGYNF